MIPLFRCIFVVWSACCLWGIAAAPLWATPSAAVLELMRGDAELADICFATPELGWAVGDRGVIWRTDDGGRNWKRQNSDCRCRLNSVYFVDEQRGWAAGGYTEPYTHVSRGVVLRTLDGGRTWNVQPRLSIPTLRRIKFFDARAGVAFGSPSALYPSGVFTTDDGGSTWTTVPASDSRTWLAGDFIDPLTGALAGDAGEIRVIRRRAIEPARSADFGLRSLASMELIAPRFGWLVGDGGLVMTTGDLGQTWQSPEGALPGMSGQFDLSALAVRDGHVWIAGSPGTRVFHSADGGRTWQAFSTGQSLPIEAIYFLDSRRGFAAGALGTILATDDGGRTWRRARSGGQRTAMVGIFSEADRIPWEMFADASAGDGYLSVACLIARRDLDSPTGGEDYLVGRAHDALVEVGGCGVEQAWRFPFRQAGLELSLEQMITTLDRANDGRAVEQLERRVVRALRTWRPEVVLTHHAAPQSDDPLSYLIGQVVLRSVESAADPTAHVDLATDAGLAPWRVKKVYGALPAGRRGSTNLDTARLVPRLGKSLADLAMESRGLVVRDYTPAPVEAGFQLLIDRTPGGQEDREIFADIALAPGGDARRMLSEPNTDMIRTLQRMAQKRRNMQQVIERMTEPAGSGQALLGNVGDLTAGLEPAGASVLLHQLAGQLVAKGRWQLAADTYQSLVDRHPNHPLAQSAQVWLVQYYASGEAAWRNRRQSSARGGEVSPAAPLAGVPAGGVGPVRLAGHVSTQLVRGLDGADAGFARASELGKQLERTQPELYARPELRFPLAAAHRKLGYQSQAARYFLSVRRSRPEDAWLANAQGERWLMERTGVSPKPLCVALSVKSKPHLDGMLDDACWRGATAIELTSPQEDDADWPAWAKLAYDQKFLYLAVHCGKASTAAYPTTDQIRPRDPDLSQHDRVDLLLDLDRDYATYYRFTVDHRGFAAESCWGDTTWNPDWYVARGGDASHWTAEAAIPLAELTGESPEAGHIWAVGLQRTAPRAGFQSWSRPAGVEVTPAGFGYLMFQ
jgi:photosystem II stability/assembly factor-like uncharacterized protein